MRKLTRLIVLMSLLLMTSIVAADDADSLYASQEWRAAVDAYEARLRNKSGDPRSWYRFGVALLMVEEYSRSAEALQTALKAGASPLHTHFQLSRSLAGLREVDDSLAHLEHAAAAGFASSQQLDDRLFASLAQTTRFENAAARIRRNEFPCRHIDGFSDFDFWLGDWTVTDGNGNTVGENRIHKTQKDCAFLESWTSSTGGTGISVNYYHPDQKSWTQTWISPATLIEISGGLDGDRMVLVGEIHYLASGNSAPFRGTWTELDDGRVEQHFEQSSDDGSSWQTWFRGYYKRKE